MQISIDFENITNASKYLFPNENIEFAVYSTFATVRLA